MLAASFALAGLCHTAGYAQEGAVSQPLVDPMVGLIQESNHVTGPASEHWWDQKASESLLDQPTWVTFGLDTVLLDTLDNSPRIKIVASQASVAIERIVQQDAAFDARVLFDTRVNRNNDPVGNSLTTGGPPRLIEENLTASGGIQQATRRGGVLDVSQEFGLANSNSTFFDPLHQGNSRLSLNLTQPLMSRSGQFYNERLLTQARIDSRVSWQGMRGEVESRIYDVVAAYWRLYELRCHYLQAIELLERGKKIETFLNARTGFDTGEIELVKIRSRIARRVLRELQLRTEILKQQAVLAQLVGSEALMTTMSTMEMIPSDMPKAPTMTWNLRDAVQTGIENRTEIRSATAQLESAALSIRVTRAELEPKLSAVFEAYLAGLNGNNRVFNSWTDQFTQGGPGMAAGLQYELPYGRRAAKSRHREAQHRYQLKTEELREVVQQTQLEIDVALVAVNAAIESQAIKQRMLDTAATEEDILTGRWEALAGDGSSVGLVLETLLDAQSRRTDAERDLVSAQTEYVVAVVQLQRAMGTLLKHSGSLPVQDRCNNSIHFVPSNSSLGNPPSPEFSKQPDEQWLEQSLGQSLEDAMELDGPAVFEEEIGQPVSGQPANVQGSEATSQPINQLGDADFDQGLSENGSSENVNRSRAAVVFVEQPVLDQPVRKQPVQTKPATKIPAMERPVIEPSVIEPSAIEPSAIASPLTRSPASQSRINKSTVSPTRLADRRNDVSQLIDTDWLEQTMYGDSTMNLKSPEETSK